MNVMLQRRDLAQSLMARFNDVYALGVADTKAAFFAISVRLPGMIPLIYNLFSYVNDEIRHASHQYKRKNGDAWQLYDCSLQNLLDSICCRPTKNHI